jgi:geranylgeranylglycerol-phosphate geranylgeranyltransferase
MGLGAGTRAFLELTRFVRPLGAAMYAFLGAFLGAPESGIPLPRVSIAAAVVGMVTAFGFVINDYCDVPVDTIGRPYRPIPSGRVSLRAAAAIAWILVALALAVSAFLGLRLAIVAAAAVALSAAYSYRLKSTLLLGNAAVALLVAAVLVYGAMAAGEITSAVVAATAITFPYILAQEALFNVEDEEQDREAGLRTTATVLGVERGVTLVRTILWSFVAIALAPWAFGHATLSYLMALTVLVLAPTALMLRSIRPPVSREAIVWAAKLSRLVWLTSFIPLATLR